MVVVPRMACVRMARADHAPPQLLWTVLTEVPTLDDALDGICSEVAHHALDLSVRPESVDLGAIDRLVVAFVAAHCDADADAVLH